LIAAAIVVVAIALVVGLVLPRGRRGRTVPPPPVRPAPGQRVPTRPPVTEAAEAPELETPELEQLEAPPALEVPEPTAGRMLRLRARLARSQNILGRGLLAVLARDKLDDDAWDEIEEVLLGADVGLASTTEIVGRLRSRTQVLGTREPAQLRQLLAEELLTALQPELDRTLHCVREAGEPAVLLVVGVNGTGKTTTCGKLARVLVADGKTVLLVAADTFRAAAADQLETWGSRVG